jgi:hypothetical protein
MRHLCIGCHNLHRIILHLSCLTGDKVKLGLLGGLEGMEVQLIDRARTDITCLISNQEYLGSSKDPIFCFPRKFSMVSNRSYGNIQG